MRLDLRKETGRVFDRLARLSVGFVAVLAVVVSVLGTTPADAQMICVMHNDLVDLLDRNYKEQPVAVGVISDGNLVEVFSSKDGDTWTIVVTRPDGVSCVLAEGEAWTETGIMMTGEVS